MSSRHPKAALAMLTVTQKGVGGVPGKEGFGTIRSRSGRLHCKVDKLYVVANRATTRNGWRVRDLDAVTDPPTSGDPSLTPE